MAGWSQCSVTSLRCIQPSNMCSRTLKSRCRYHTVRSDEHAHDDALHLHHLIADNAVVDMQTNSRAPGSLEDASVIAGDT